MNWLLDWFSQIWTFLVGLKNSVSGWFSQTWTRILGVQTAVDALRALVEQRFDQIEERIARQGAKDRAQMLVIEYGVHHIRELLITPPAPQRSLLFSIQIEGNTLQGVTQMTLQPGKRYRASVTTQPAGSRVDGALSWASSDDTVLTVTPEGDGRTAVIETLADGVATIEVSGDADLGEGVRPISATVGVIVGLEAESLAIHVEEIPAE